MYVCLQGSRGSESRSNSLFSDVPYGVRVTGASATVVHGYRTPQALFTLKNSKINQKSFFFLKIHTAFYK